jgi:hypothetical protein
MFTAARASLTLILLPLLGLFLDEATSFLRAQSPCDDYCRNRKFMYFCSSSTCVKFDKAQCLFCYGKGGRCKPVNGENDPFCNTPLTFPQINYYSGKGCMLSCSCDDSISFVESAGGTSYDTKNSTAYYWCCPDSKGCPDPPPS